jgi:tetratricopeptide (TPR) repeat protein
LGRPYFAMELVRGVKITEYCDQANLSTVDRLKLFMAVCHAVQHAHQKGIIHRDLKPSNILVTLHDGTPVPKVIDFGVAKATQQQRLTDLTLFTQFEQMVGTPLYMSPEQAEMSGLDIDTRSDIYSLGVLLYELLTGRTPFDPKELMKKGLDEMRRVIREQEPQKPSTFVSTMAISIRTTVAQRRNADGAKLVGQIRGDLDWIVMKALEKDRNRRYETASGFARDIERHLLSEPIQARPASSAYRLRKLLRRQKKVATAIAAVVVALIGALTLTTWMYFNEKRARGRASSAEKSQAAARKTAETETENAQAEAGRARSEARQANAWAKKSQHVTHFLAGMLRGVAPSTALGDDPSLLKEILDGEIERIDQDTESAPEVKATLLQEIAMFYYALADFEKAEVNLRRALSLGQSEPAGTELTRARCLSGLGAVLLLNFQRLDEAEASLRQSLEIKKRLLGPDSFELADSTVLLAMVLRRKGSALEASELTRSVLNVERSDWSELDLSGGETTLALIFAATRRDSSERAESNIEEELDLGRKLYGDKNPSLAAAFVKFGESVAEAKPAKSQSFVKEGLEMFRKVYGDLHLFVARSLWILGLAMEKARKFDQAETVYRELVDASPKRAGSFAYGPVNDELHRLCRVLEKQGKFDESEKLLRDVLDGNRRINGNQDSSVASVLNRLATLLAMVGRIAEAESVSREALAIAWTADGGEPVRVVPQLDALAGILQTAKKHVAAVSVLRESLSLTKQFMGEDQTRTAMASHRLAHALEKIGQKEEAESLFREALTIHTKLLGREHLSSSQDLACLSLFLLESKQHEKAQSVTQELLSIREKTIPDNWLKFNAEAMCGGAFLGQRKYDQARALLLSGYFGMQQREASIPIEGQIRVRETIQRLVGLYAAVGNRQDRAVWEKKLQEHIKRYPALIEAGHP